MKTILVSSRSRSHGASRNRGMAQQEEAPTLNFHRELYPYMHKAQPAKIGRGNLGTHVAAWLAANGPATVEDISKGTGVSDRVLLEYLRLGKIPGAVEVGVLQNGKGRPSKIWGIHGVS